MEFICEMSHNPRCFNYATFYLETADYKMSESELKLKSRKDVETVVVKVIHTWNV